MLELYDAARPFCVVYILLAPVFKRVGDTIPRVVAGCKPSVTVVRCLSAVSGFTISLGRL